MEARVTPNLAGNAEAAIKYILNIGRTTPDRPVVGRTIEKRESKAVKLRNTPVSFPGTHSDHILTPEHHFNPETIGKAAKQHFVKFIPPNRTNINLQTMW
jgi:hypothetical protein